MGGGVGPTGSGEFVFVNYFSSHKCVIFDAFLPIYLNWFSGNEASGSAFPQVGIQDSGIDSGASGVYSIFIFSSNYESCDFCVYFFHGCFGFVF